MGANVKQRFHISELMSSVRAVAAEHPDHEYIAPADAGCLYDRDTDGTGIARHGCLIGRALLRLGVPEEVILQSTWAIGTRLGYSHGGFEPEYGDTLRHWFRGLNDEAVVHWVTEVQSTQDGHSTWGDAITHADQEHPEALHPF